MNLSCINILVPIYNDWESFRTVLGLVDTVAGENGYQVHVHVVNDGSVEDIPKDLLSSLPLDNIHSLEIINLVCNMGHQRALAIGLAYLMKQDYKVPVLIMDGDGEDNPNDIPKLIDAYDNNPGRIILAQRTERSEGAVFRLFYRFYKLIFRVLTGYGISFGNYCLLPGNVAKRMIFMPSLWNSLPATALQSKVPYVLIPSPRASRVLGKSQMGGFTNLILHGMNSLSVFATRAMVRMAIAVAMLSVTLIALVAVIRFGTDWVAPVWASNMVGFLIIFIVVAFFVLFVGVLMTLLSRSSMQMLPAIHSDVLIQGIRKLR